MRVYQREIVEVVFNLPQGNLAHPVLVISNNDINEFEGSFIGLMGTTDHLNDEYAFLLTEEMLTKPMPQQTELRCHLISFFHDKDVISKYGSSVKKEVMKLILDQIYNTSFKID